MKAFRYTAVPEKYFTPGSPCSLQEANFGKVTFGGAPPPGRELQLPGAGDFLRLGQRRHAAAKRPPGIGLQLILPCLPGRQPQLSVGGKVDLGDVLRNIIVGQIRQQIERLGVLAAGMMGPAVERVVHFQRLDDAGAGSSPAASSDTRTRARPGRSVLAASPAPGGCVSGRSTTRKSPFGSRWRVSPPTAESAVRDRGGRRG